MKNRKVEMFMWIAAVCVVSNIYLFIPIYSAVAEGLSITYEEVVFSSTLFTCSYAIGLLCFGYIATFFPKRKVLFYGMIASSLLTIALSFSFSLSSFYLLRCSQGFVLGSFAPVAYAYCFDVFETKRRITVIAIINSGFLMAGIIGQLASSTIVNAFGWREVFYLYSCLYLGIAFFTLLILPKEHPKLIKQHRNTVATQSSGKLIQAPVILGISIAFITLMSFVTFYDGLAQFFAGQEIELFYSRCIGLIGTPLCLFSSLLLKRYRIKNILLTCLVTMAGSFLLMLLSNQLMIISVLSILFVAAIAVFIPTLITFIGDAATAKRPIAISFYTFFLLTGASLGPIIATVLSFQAILIFFSILFSFAAFLLLFTKVQISERS